MKYVISLDSKINFIKQFSECIWFYTDLSKDIKTTGWKNTADDSLCFSFSFCARRNFFYIQYHNNIGQYIWYCLLTCPFLVFSYNTVTLIKHFKTWKMIGSWFCFVLNYRSAFFFFCWFSEFTVALLLSSLLPLFLSKISFIHHLKKKLKTSFTFIL